MYEGEGTYKHHKGGEYQVFGLGIMEHMKDRLEDMFDANNDALQNVVYAPLTPGGLLADSNVTFWIRTMEEFNQPAPCGQQCSFTISCRCKGTGLVERFQRIK